jgi:hypothetical protein
MSSDQAKQLRCPITQEIMVHPVILVGEGITYEREAILKWFRTLRSKREKLTGPSTRMPLTNDGDADLVYNFAMRSLIDEYLASNGKPKQNTIPMDKNGPRLRIELPKKASQAPIRKVSDETYEKVLKGKLAWQKKHEDTHRQLMEAEDKIRSLRSQLTNLKSKLKYDQLSPFEQNGYTGKSRLRSYRNVV